MRVKFGVLEQTQGLQLHAKFHLNLFIVLAFGGQKPQFWAFFYIWGGLLYRHLFIDKGQIWCTIADPRYMLTAKFRLDRFNLSSCGGENLQFLPFFRLPHLVVSPVSIILRKLNTGAQLQTFPYPMASKSFLYSNPFMAKSGAKAVTFKRVTNRKTDKNNVFGRPAAGESEPHQTWHGDRGPRTRSCTSKTFGGLTHSFAARGR